MPKLTQANLHRIPVVAPGLGHQQQIAELLGPLDEKIELNRRMNRTLEEIARAIFRSWFVDFDPVRAKAAGREPAGMDAETAALFPDAFADSELGPIPAGWKVEPLSNLVNPVRRTVNPGAFPDERFDHFSLPAYDAGQLPEVQLGSTIKSNKTIVEPGAVLISKLNPRIPRVWLPSVGHERRSLGSTEFLVLIPQMPERREFIYGLVSSERFLADYGSRVTGTTGSHQRVSPDSLLAMRVASPGFQLADQFGQLVAPLFELASLHRASSQTLAKLRDTLLPKLLSGELRIGAAERAAAGVA